MDVILGPEMRSTGEVMGIDMSFGLAFAKSQMAAGVPLPTAARSSSRVRDATSRTSSASARRLAEMGFDLVATGGTHRVLARPACPAGGSTSSARAGPTSPT